MLILTAIRNTQRIAYDGLMPNYHVRLSFKSDRELDQIEKFFEMVVKGLKLDRAPRLVIEARAASGPDAVQYKKVERWIKRRTRQEPWTTRELAEALNMNRSTAWKTLEKIEKDGGLITSDTKIIRGSLRRVYRKLKADEI